MFRTLTERQLAFDITTAALCVLLRFGIGVDSTAGYVVVAMMGAGLALRRVSPPLALCVVWLGAILQILTGQQPDLSNLAILPVLYATAAYGNATLRWLGLASAGVGAALIAVYLNIFVLFYPAFDLSQLPPDYLFRNILLQFVLWSVVFGLSWTIGLLVRTARLAREGRAALAQAEKDEALAQHEVAIEQERNRIARDMHDVVAHSLAVVIAQADGARYAAKSDAGTVDEALVTIASTAREALGDVRLLLGQLRHSQGESPQPMLADLGRLFDQMRTAGLDIVCEDEGDQPQLGTGRQLAVYRIVQEALTNALRHGDTEQEVVVRLEWRQSELEITVDNAVAAPAQSELDRLPGAGHGLAGMGERASIAGGALTAEQFGRRFVVTATIPIDRQQGESS